MPILKSKPRSNTGVRPYSRLFWLSLCTFCAMIVLNVLHRMTSRNNMQRKNREEEYRISSLYTYGEDNPSLHQIHEEGSRMDIHGPQQLLDARPQQFFDAQRQEVASLQPIPGTTSNFVSSYVTKEEYPEVDFSGVIQKAKIEDDVKADSTVVQNTNDGAVADDSEVTYGIVKIKGVNSGGVEEIFDLPYYHCGPFYTLGANQVGDDADSTNEVAKIYHEYLFLHGAAYTKEDWKSSGILKQMCTRTQRDIETLMYFSVTALDLPAQSDAVTLARAFDALAEANIISGLPIIIVSPSASGRGVLDLASVSQSQTKIESKEAIEKGLSPSPHLSLLETMLLAWVPIACYDVSTVQDSSLFDVFETSHIPILAIYGSNDKRGQEVANRLEKLAAAKTVMLGTNHACYLDDPNKFVETLKSIFPKVPG